jgi:hypothetical protein
MNVELVGNQGVLGYLLVIVVQTPTSNQPAQSSFAKNKINQLHNNSFRSTSWLWHSSRKFVHRSVPAGVAPVHPLRARMSIFGGKATKLVNPFSPGSTIVLSALIDSTPILPIVSRLRAKYRADINPIPTTPRGNSFTQGKHVYVPLFHGLPSRDYELYRASLSRINHDHFKSPIEVFEPFKYTRKRPTPMASIGFNIISAEIISIRHKLAVDLKEFMSLERRNFARQLIANPNQRNPNVQYHPMIKFMYEIDPTRAEEILRDIKQRYPTKVTTSTLFGFCLQEYKHKGSSRQTTEDFLYQK